MTATMRIQQSIQVCWTDDGIDNNCNNQIDEGFDVDGDGFTPIFGGDCDDMMQPFTQVLKKSAVIIR